MVELPAPSRTRNAAATRQAILDAAHHRFAKEGYDGASLREIAADAKVDAALVSRYFGSKEQLFAAVVADTMRDPVILSGDNITSDQVAARFARALVGLSAPGEDVLDGFRVMWKSGCSEVASGIAREQIVAVHQATTAGVMAGDHVRQRAALLLSLVAGVQLMRQQIALPALTEADPEVLVTLLQPLFAALLAKR